MRKFEKKFWEDSKHDLEVFDALMKDGSFEEAKNGIKDLHKCLLNQCKKIRKENFKKNFFIGTTLGLGSYILCSKYQKKETTE